MYPNPTHFLIPLYLPSALKKKKNLIVEAVVHCNESLVGFEASGFYYTTNTTTLLGSSLISFLLPCVMEIL